MWTLLSKKLFLLLNIYYIRVIRVKLLNYVLRGILAVMTFDVNALNTKNYKLKTNFRSPTRHWSFDEWIAQRILSVSCFFISFSTEFYSVEKLIKLNKNKFE